MGSVEEYECKACGHTFEAEIGGGYLSLLFRCPSCGTTHTIRRGRMDAERVIDFRSLVCDSPEDHPLCPHCKTEMRTGIPPLCPHCRSSLIRYRKTVLTYD